MPSRTGIRDRLGLPASAAKWYDIWEAVDVSQQPVPVPSPAQIEALLDRMGVDAVDATAVARARPSPATDVELWWVIERCYSQLVADMGGVGMMLWPQLPDKWGVAGRFVHLYALLAAIPRLLEYNRSKGIDDDITWETVANVAEKLRVNRSRHGFVGLEVAHWFTLHFRGGLYRLGRLEFAPEVVGSHRSIPGLNDDDLVLGIHIPQDGGPMTPQACATSIKRARSFFSDRFGERFGREPVFVCSSWLLDPRLGQYLRRDSNIAAFQQLFTLLEPADDARENGTKDVLRFVFDRVGPTDPATLPRDSSLRCALADGLADDTGWHVRTGWFI